MKKLRKIFTDPSAQRPHLNPLPGREETNSNWTLSPPLSRWDRWTPLSGASEGKEEREDDIGRGCLGNQGWRPYAKRPVRTARLIKSTLLALALASLIGLVSCESTSFAPPPAVTAQMAERKGERVNVATLDKGRTLFVHRCIECHTLPPFWHYRTKDWPQLVDAMAHRARLKPEERDAILAYILAARAQ